LNLFKYYELGYDFLKGTALNELEDVPIPRNLSAERKAQIERVATNTSRMLLFAIEQSGSGPPKGYMNLDENDAGGTAAFLRSVQHFVTPRTLTRNEATILSEDQGPTIISPMETMKTDWVRSYEGNNIDGTYKIARSAVSPLVLFLHVDQGSLAKVGYTPFASPVANSRSVYQQHARKVSSELMDSAGILSQEDFAVLGYQILLHGEEPPEPEELRPIKYRCILNRDDKSEDTIVSKEVIVVTNDNLEHIYKKVSESLMMISFVDHHSNLRLHNCTILFCFVSSAVWN
jgi:hypothetical protein